MKVELGRDEPKFTVACACGQSLVVRGPGKGKGTVDYEVPYHDHETDTWLVQIVRAKA